MERTDYTQAWAMIEAWNDPELRARTLAAATASERRPLVALALIRTAALMANAAAVGAGLSEQLAGTRYAEIETGVLSITDQIMAALEADDTVDTAGALQDLREMVDALAAHEAD